MYIALTGVLALSARHFSTTMTTKQHYFLHIVSGVAVIVLMVVLEKLYSKNRGAQWSLFAKSKPDVI
jgi:hypothetical protein